jgi:hypothetical protein
MIQRLEKNNILYYFIISCIAIFAYWNVATCKRTLKWDMIDANYPFQVFQSQLEHNGEIPLWDPYTYLGNAMHSKMQQYYPIRFISSKISIYTLQKLNWEFVLHIILAGIGMFLFLKRLSFSKLISLIFGISYMLSGFFSGNAQHMGWIVSGALLPFVLLTYYNLISSPKPAKLFQFSLVFVSFILGGYPAFSIVICYAIGLYFCYINIKLLWYKNYQVFLKILKYHSFFILIFFILLGIAIVSYSDMVSMITRGNGVSLESALFGSLRPIHFLTFIFPLLIAFHQNDFWGISCSLMNISFGIIGILFSIYSLRFIKNKKIIILWIISVFFIGMSMGKDLPLRSFFYNNIPMFDVFRMPSLFRLFFIFTFIILAAFSFNDIIGRINKKHIFYIGITSTILIIGSIIFLLNGFISHSLRITSWDVFIGLITIKQILAIHILIYSSLALLCSFILYFFFIKKGLFTLSVVSIAIGIFVICDVIISTKMNIPITVTNSTNLCSVQNKVNTLPIETSLINIHEKAYSQYSKELSLVSPFLRNNQLFFKKRTYDGYTSFVYKTTENFERSKIFDSVKSYPLIYFPNKIYGEQDSIFDYTQGRIATLRNDILQNQSFQVNSNSIKLKYSKTNDFIFDVYSKESAPLVFMQNYYPGWKAFINKKEVPIIIANYSCMGILIPQGNSEIRFTYAPKQAILWYYIYEVSLYILILLVLFYTIPKEKRNIRFIVILLFSVFIICIELKNHFL